MACFSGFLTGREVAKHMVAHKNGTIIFTGATASIRGGSGYAAFSGELFFCIEQLKLYKSSYFLKVCLHTTTETLMVDGCILLSLVLFLRDKGR